jgi:hypothetical protein
MGMNRSREAAERFAERRRRQDEAQRLKDVVPRLSACKIDFVDSREGVTSANVSHTRRIVVARAPAILTVACGDSGCRDGGHDVTEMWLRGLRDGRVEIKGESRCRGTSSGADCERILRFTAFAEYEPDA